jgi:hypothetical protein
MNLINRLWICIIIFYRFLMSNCSETGLGVKGSSVAKWFGIMCLTHCCNFRSDPLLEKVVCSTCSVHQRERVRILLRRYCQKRDLNLRVLIQVGLIGGSSCFWGRYAYGEVLGSRLVFDIPGESAPSLARTSSEAADNFLIVVWNGIISFL